MLRKAVPTDIVDLKDEVDGAWADGKAPLKLIAEFMSLIQSQKFQDALPLASQILEYEPENETIQEFIPVLTRRIQEMDDDSSSSNESSSDSSGSDTEFSDLKIAEAKQ